MDLRQVLDNMDNLKSRSIPEKEWPSHSSSSGMGKVFDPKSIKYKEKQVGISQPHPFKNFKAVVGEYTGYMRNDSIYAFGQFKYMDQLFAEDNFSYWGEFAVVDPNLPPLPHG